MNNKTLLELSYMFTVEITGEKKGKLEVHGHFDPSSIDTRPTKARLLCRGGLPPSMLSLAGEPVSQGPALAPQPCHLLFFLSLSFTRLCPLSRRYCTLSTLPLLAAFWSLLLGL